MISAPILSYPDLRKRFILDIDASGFCLGAVLSGTKRRRTRQYCVTRRELLVIVQSIKHYYHYMYGKNFLVRTDHGALHWLMNFKNPEGQLARWLEVLSSYDFKIQHRPGRQHLNAD